VPPTAETEKKLLKMKIWRSTVEVSVRGKDKGAYKRMDRGLTAAIAHFEDFNDEIDPSSVEEDFVQLQSDFVLLALTHQTENT